MPNAEKSAAAGTNNPDPASTIYLDHAATTPLSSEVLEAMTPYLTQHFGNPNSLHQTGRAARRAVETARAEVAELLHAQNGLVVLTAGGTEADNLALQGVANARKTQGNHIITSAIEHHAILHACQKLERRGFEVSYLPVDSHGKVALDDLRQALRDETILVSVMTGNNEVGTIQPIAEIGEILADHPAYFHTDAVQAVGHLPVDVESLGIDLLSLSAHKFYGPKGSGALFVREGVDVEALLHGGGQEYGLRGGTENVAGIVGLGAAAKLARKRIKAEKETHLSALRDRLIAGVLERVEGAVLTGHPSDRLPGSASFCFAGVMGESLLLKLDMHGIRVSSGSACTSGHLDPSHVLLAMGLSKPLANGSIRMTLGQGSSGPDVERVLALLPAAVTQVREMAF